jgi:hypothetical protein
MRYHDGLYDNKQLPFVSEPVDVVLLDTTWTQSILADNFLVNK